MQQFAHRRLIEVELGPDRDLRVAFRQAYQDLQLGDGEQHRAAPPSLLMAHGSVGPADREAGLLAIIWRRHIDAGAFGIRPRVLTRLYWGHSHAPVPTWSSIGRRPAYVDA